MATRDSVLSAIELNNLTFRYGNSVALAEVSATIPAAAQVAVVGPNGAGKSTLFKGLVGLLPFHSGQALIYGQPVEEIRRQIAYVPQRSEIDWQFPVTVLDVVLMGRYGHLGWLRRPSRHDHALARHCLDSLGIEHLAPKPIGELSGGQQQRVFLARAIAQEPRILILDEPFAGVDAPTQEIALGLLDQLSEQGITQLVATHDLALAATRFDSIMLLNRRMIAFGPPKEVLTSPALTATFGAQVLIYRNGDGLIAVADHCCPPELVQTFGDHRGSP